MQMYDYHPLDASSPPFMFGSLRGSLHSQPRDEQAVLADSHGETNHSLAKVLRHLGKKLRIVEMGDLCVMREQ